MRGPPERSQETMAERVHLPISGQPKSGQPSPGQPAEEGRTTDDLGVRTDVRNEQSEHEGPVLGIADPWRDRKPEPDRAVSCIMADSLYVKANGEMPCWCDSGEQLILETLTVEKLMDPSFDAFNHPKIQVIRDAFHREDRYPFPSTCRRCAMVYPDAERDRSLYRDGIDTLHVESSWLCNLDCPLCIPKKERKSLKDPPFHVEPSLWVALVHNLKLHGVKRVRMLHFEGRGDPLMHPHLGHLCKVFHMSYPDAIIQATTNGNFPFKDDLFEGGLTHLRISADGAREESYQTYRRGGKFAKVHKFMADAAECRTRLGLQDRVHIEWKYILFEWNDTDEEMLEAYQIANDIGIELSFCLTPWEGKSLRFDNDNLSEKLAEIMPSAQNRPTRHIELGLDHQNDAAQ